MADRCGGQRDGLSGYWSKAFDPRSGRLSDRLGADLKGGSGAILRKPFGLSNCTVVIAAAFLAKSIGGRLLPLTAGMLRLAVIDDTPANAGRDLSGDQEYKENCCELFQHLPVRNMEPITSFVNKMFSGAPLYLTISMPKVRFNITLCDAKIYGIQL